MKGLEPPLPKELDPKSSASTNSATSAKFSANLTQFSGLQRWDRVIAVRNSGPGIPFLPVRLLQVACSSCLQDGSFEHQVSPVCDGQGFMDIVIGDQDPDVSCPSVVDTMSWISSTAMGSTPAKGSSSRMKFGFRASARAISVLLLSPPDN